MDELHKTEGGAVGDLKWVALEEIRLAEPFTSLFERDPERVRLIARSIQESGYDLAHPVSVWANGKYSQRNALIDGYTRYEAVKQAGCTEGQIFACFRKIPDEEQALDYALEAQGRRRNLTDWDIFHVVRAVDRLQENGGKRAGAGRKSRLEDISNNANNQRQTSASEKKSPKGEENSVPAASPEALYRQMLAAERLRDRLSCLLQVNRDKIQQCFSLIRHGNETELALIREQSIHAAYLALRARRREEARSEQAGAAHPAPVEAYYHYHAGRLFVKRGGKPCRFLELDTHAFPGSEERFAFEKALDALLRRHMRRWTASDAGGLEAFGEEERRQLELEFGWESLT